jgi:hypothetical protein
VSPETRDGQIRVSCSQEEVNWKCRDLSQSRQPSFWPAWNKIKDGFSGSESDKDKSTDKRVRFLFVYK